MRGWALEHAAILQVQYHVYPHGREAFIYLMNPLLLCQAMECENDPHGLEFLVLEYSLKAAQQPAD